MGMAASQARFLGLTARKTNVEYQGQQVNQTRTALANESAGLFNSMMGLKVPTPPVVNQYYTSRYNFDSATNTNYSISSMSEIAGSPGEYAVIVDYVKQILTGYKNPGSDTDVVFNGTDVVFDNGTKTALPIGQGTTDKEKNDIKAILANPTFASPPYSYSDTTDFYKYEAAVNGSIITYYVSPYEEIDPNTQTPTGNYFSPVLYTQNKATNSQATATATFVEDPKNGRYTSTILHGIQPADAAKDIGEGLSYDLAISQTYDEKGYTQAMQNYEFDKMKYENEIQIINAKTEKLQMEDRTLELKLRQLDTEQKALQTEMESVQKVIQKNVETTFKTFTA